MQFVVEGANVYAYTGTRSFDAALPTVIFLHGAANDHSVWALQSRYFAHHGWNTLAVDLPGHGRSTGEALSAVSQNADWTIRAMDALDIARAALVGHSMGSLAALDAAGRYAERVTKLALLAPSVPMPVSEALLKASRANEHLAYELITEWSFSPEHQTGGNQQPGIWMTGNGLRLMERSRPGVLYTDLCACNDYADGLAAARAVRCPVLLILGERDRMAPARNARELISALAEKRVVTLPDSGHSLMTEAPDAVLDALRGFL
jgi:pimeloyl-ACP methyl ester carboxylesterase